MIPLWIVTEQAPSAGVVLAGFSHEEFIWATAQNYWKADQ